MRKRLALFLGTMMVGSMLVGCGGGAESSGEAAAPVAGEETAQGTEAPAPEDTDTTRAQTDGGTKKIAFAVNTLDNEIWALTATCLETYGAERGYEVTTLSANANASTQIDQLESCIEAGYDVIALDPVDTSSVEDVCKKAMDAGIVVVNYGQEFQNATTSIILDEVTTGTNMGKNAAAWVKENWGDKDHYKVICVGLDTVPVLVTRLDSFKEGFASELPEAEFVTDINGASAVESMTAGESALQANPDINICLAIGGDQAYGFVQAAIAAGISQDEMVAFAIDATEQSMKMLKNREYFEGIMSVGSVEAKTRLLMDTIEACVNGDEVPVRTYFEEDWISRDNIDAKFEEYGYTE